MIDLDADFELLRFVGRKDLAGIDCNLGRNVALAQPFDAVGVNRDVCQGLTTRPASGVTALLSEEEVTAPVGLKLSDLIS